MFKLVDGITKPVKITSSTFQGEVLAIRQARVLVRAMVIRQAVVESDNKHAIVRALVSLS